MAEAKSDDPRWARLLSDAKKRHERGVSELEATCECLIRLNARIQGRTGDRLIVTASSFFTLICLQALQLRRMLSLDPHRPIGPMTAPFPLRDSFSPTVLARAMLETYLNFFYLCVESAEPAQRELRFAIWDWHDYDDRLRGAGESPEHEKEFREFSDARDQMRARIISLPAWGTLPPKHKSRAFAEGMAIAKPKRAIAQSAGISDQYYEMVHTFLSTYVHGAPLAVQHNLALGEGSLEAEIMQWTFLSRQIDITIWLCCSAVRDTVSLFPDLSTEVPVEVVQLTDVWTEIVRHWGEKAEQQ